MVIDRNAYERGFVRAIQHVKLAMQSAAPDAGAEEASQQGAGSNTNGPDAVMDTTVPFGKKGPAEVKNLKDIFMKRDDLSHGPSSSTSGEGTKNYKG